MDPVSIVGLVGSVFGVADIVAKSIRGLVSLQATYRSADLLVTIIVGHLSTVQAILDEIRDWLGGLKDESEYAVLLGKIDMAVGCCAIIAEVLFEKVDALRNSAARKLTVKGKLLYMLDESSIKDMNSHLSTQVQALHILVDAARCKTSKERNSVLNDVETRSILQQIQDDSRSHIYTASEVASVLSRRSHFSGNSYLSNIDFDFDAAVLSSRVYQNAFGTWNHQQSERNVSQSTQRLRTKSSISTIKQTEHDLGAEEARSISSSVQLMEPDISADASSSTSDEVLSQRSATRPLDAPIPSTRSEVDHQNGFYQSTALDDGSGTRGGRTSALAKTIKKSLTSSAPRSPDALRKYWTKQLDRQLSNTSTDGKPHHSRMRSLNLLFKPKAESKEDREARLCDEAITAWLKDGDQAFKPAKPRIPEHKVLILGTSDSGKSTLLKSLKLQLEGTYTKEERESFQEVIRDNTMLSMRNILEAMEDLEIPLDDQERQSDVQTILMQSDCVDYTTTQLKRCQEAIFRLRDDPGVKECISRSREYQLADCTAYCFANIERIFDMDYMPSDEDILWTRIKTAGVSETYFKTSGAKYYVFDCGGMRSGRRQWIHTFENVTCILFTVDIANYDRLLFEDETVNRMEDQLTVFDAIVNSRWFTKTNFVLLFTKIDCLMQKLKTSPLSNYFPDYTGTDFNQAADYIRERFLSLVQDKEKLVYPYFCTFVSSETAPKFDFKVIEKIMSGS